MEWAADSRVDRYKDMCLKHLFIALRCIAGETLVLVSSARKIAVISKIWFVNYTFSRGPCSCMSTLWPEEDSAVTRHDRMLAVDGNECRMSLAQIYILKISYLVFKFFLVQKFKSIIFILMAFANFAAFII
jgi:hypothetical protein